MEIRGEQRIAAPKRIVWDALTDADVLRECIPGAADVVKVSATEYTATITARVGPVKARLRGHIVLSDVDVPNSYTLTGQGRGAVGFSKVESRVSLIEDGEVTSLMYVVKATVGGKLAKVGDRLIGGVAGRMTSDFFTTLNETVTAGGVSNRP